MTEYCGHSMRDGTCNLNAGHRGRHTTVAQYCDVCGKMRRGTLKPIMQRISPFETEHVADYCFMCERGLEEPKRVVYGTWT